MQTFAIAMDEIDDDSDHACETKDVEMHTRFVDDEDDEDEERASWDQAPPAAEAMAERREDAPAPVARSSWEETASPATIASRKASVAEDAPENFDDVDTGAHFPAHGQHLGVDVVKRRSACGGLRETNFVAYSLAAGPPGNRDWSVYGAQDSMVAAYPRSAVRSLQYRNVRCGLRAPPCELPRCRRWRICGGGGEGESDDENDGANASVAEDDGGGGASSSGLSVTLYSGATDRDGRAVRREALGVLDFVKLGGKKNSGTWEAVLRGREGAPALATYARQGVLTCVGPVLGTAYSVRDDTRGLTYETTDLVAGGRATCCSAKDDAYRREITPNGATVVGAVVRSNVNPLRCHRLRPTIRHPPDGICHGLPGFDDVHVAHTLSVGMPLPGPEQATIWFAAAIFQFVSSSATFQPN